MDVNTLLTKDGGWELASLVRFKPGNNRVLYYGMPGTGKTTTDQLEAERRGFRVYSYTVHTEMQPSELTAYWSVVNGNFELRLGLIAQAFEDSWDPAIPGVLVVINEPDHGAGAIMSIHHNILDDPAIARLYLPDGRVLRPNPDKLYFLVTMNGQPEDLSDALRDRLPVKINITQPNPAAVARLSEDLRPLAVAYGHPPSTGGNVPTFRQLLQFDELRKEVGADVAAACVFGAAGSDFLASLVVASVTGLKKRTR